jgi:diguanylate cyclase (GGDEF)-like protein
LIVELLSSHVVLSDFAGIEAHFKTLLGHDDIIALRYRGEYGGIVETITPSRTSTTPSWFAMFYAIPAIKNATPVEISGKRYGTIELTMGGQSQIDALWLLAKISVGLLLYLAVMIVFIGYLIRKNLKPLRQFQHLSQQLAQGDYTVRAEEFGCPELRRITLAFNNMALELETKQEQLHHLAYFDALTGLPNRALLADRMHMALTQAQRNKTMLAVCYIDLDRFKPINDTFGHEMGDKVLIEVSRRLAVNLRGGETAARLGGDEFVLLLCDIKDSDAAQKAIARIIATMEEPITLDGATHRISVSIGVSLFPLDDNDADALLRHADQALYVAKESGRARYHLFDSAAEIQKHQYEDRLLRKAKALAQNEFRLFYQPKVDIGIGKIVGVEALVRWQHPEYGLLLPSEFLSVIENSPLEVPLGEWVIGEALRQMSEWRKVGLDIAVSVNISARHLAQNNFVARLRDFLVQYPDMPRHHFEIEILETAALDNIDYISQLINECRQMGVRFALDDFGTGYSSLAYFRCLPVNLVKIDQSFIRDMLIDTDDLAIVESIIGLAGAFRREVIAEGVETLEHTIMLLNIDCTLVQGYAIARPLPADQFLVWMREWQPDPVWKKVAGAR